MDFIFVPKGTTSIENGNISVGYDFKIGKYEVTQAEWEEVMTGNVNGISATPSYFAGLPNNPVEQVSWYDSLVFCNRKSIQDGLVPVYSIGGTTNPDSWGTTPTSNDETWDAVIPDNLANGYRLPTPVEWEYSARGGAGGLLTIYAGSNNIDEVAWWSTNSGDITHTAGTKLPNELGIYDMSGNISELTEEGVGGAGWRYIVGGSHYDDTYYCQVNTTTNVYSYERWKTTGLRVVSLNIINPDTEGDIKLDIGLYSASLSPAYYNGYFNKMFSDGLNSISSNEVHLNPNVLPKIYEYGIEVNGTEYNTGLQVPLIPAEEKTIYIENYIMPESSTFNSDGYVSDIDKYYGVYTNCPYSKEFYDTKEPTDSFPFLLLTDKVYNSADGNIEYRDFDNQGIELSFLPSDKPNYKSRIIIKNTNTEQILTQEIKPLLVMSSILQIALSDYNKISVGNVLKLNKKYSDKSNKFNSLYELYKEYKYKIIGKDFDSSTSSYYITLDKIYPYVLDDDEYMSSSLYNENIIHLNYFSIRGNPMVSKDGEYSLEDLPSIDRYGEKTYSLKTGLFSLEYLNKLSNVMVEERKSVSYDEDTNTFYYDSKNTKFIAEFSMESFTIGLGDIIYITEDYYYNMIKEPFMVIKLTRRCSANGERVLKVKAVSKRLFKEYIPQVFEEIETSSIKSISSLDPTNYLTDKTILTTSYTNEFGEMYTSSKKTCIVTASLNGHITIDISNVGGIDFDNIVLCINDIYYDVLNTKDSSSVTFINYIVLENSDSSNKIKVGDIAYVYSKTKKTTAEMEVSSYKSARAENMLYLKWNCDDIYDSTTIRVYSSDSYSDATNKTIYSLTPVGTLANFKNGFVTIGIRGDLDISVNNIGKYYTVALEIVDLLGNQFIQDKITVYSPTTTGNLGVSQTI